MTSHRLTGSRVALAERCLYWARPDVPLPARASSVAADLGSATHEAIEVAGMGEGVSSAESGDAANDDETIGDAFRDVAGRDLESAARLDDAAKRWKLAPSARAQLEALYETWAEWWPSFRGEDVYRHEVPMAWNTAPWTARELPSRHHRDYSAIAASEIPLTIDALHVPETQILGRSRGTVIDWKTGRTRQPPAAVHAQLATAALCAAHVYGLDRVRVALVRILPGYVRVDAAELDTMALDSRALSLEAMLRAIPTAEPIPGSWCASEYCPALATCQGPRVLAARAPDLAAALPVTVTTEAEAAAVLGAMKPLQAYLDGLKRAAIEWAERHGGRVRMPDGSTMVRTPTVRRALDVDRCLPALRNHVGDLGAEGLVTVKRSLSVDKVETAVKSLHPRGKKKAAVAAAMADLETSGGVRVTSYDTWEMEAAPKPDPKEEDRDI